MNEFHSLGHFCPKYKKPPDSVLKVDVFLNCVAF